MTVQDAVKQSRSGVLPGTRFLRRAIGVSIFLVSAAVFGYLTLNVAVKRGESVTVPNLVNKSVVEALDILSERGLELRKTGSRNSALIPENYILSQDPLPGTVVKSSSPVSVIISLGSKMTVVPNLIGKPLREARVELTMAALQPGRFSEIHFEGENDVVLAQSPLPNEEVSRDTQVNLLIGLGALPREYRLPALIGSPLDKASALLDKMGLSVGDVTTRLDLSRPQGTILGQDPAPGSLMVQGSSVSLVMSTMRAEGEDEERKFGILVYQAPYGFWPKSLRVEISDADGTRTIYDEVDEPGAAIRLVFGYSVQSTVRVYLDSKLDTERIYR